MTEQIKSREQITAEAAAAAAAGRPVTANPYQQGSEAYTAWRREWANHSAVVA